MLPVVICAMGVHGRVKSVGSPSTQLCRSEVGQALAGLRLLKTSRRARRSAPPPSGGAPWPAQSTHTHRTTAQGISNRTEAAARKPAGLGPAARTILAHRPGSRFFTGPDGVLGRRARAAGWKMPQ